MSKENPELKQLKAELENLRAELRQKDSELEKAKGLVRDLEDTPRP